MLCDVTSLLCFDPHLLALGALTAAATAAFCTASLLRPQGVLLEFLVHSYELDLFHSIRLPHTTTTAAGKEGYRVKMLRGIVILRWRIGEVSVGHATILGHVPAPQRYQTQADAGMKTHQSKEEGEMHGHSDELPLKQAVSNKNS